MAAIAHGHVKHPPRQQENVVPVCSMSSNSGDHLPSYLPEDEVDAHLQGIPSANHLLDHGLVNPERFTSSEEYGDLYRSSSNSSNQRVLTPGSLSTRYPSYLPESDDDTEVHRLHNSDRAQDFSNQSHLSGNAKLHARSGRHSSVKNDTRNPLNGVKKSLMQKVNQEENRNSHLSSGLGSLSSCLSNNIGGEVHVSPQGPTASVNKEVPLGSSRGSSIPESAERLSLYQRTQSSDSVESCQSAKTAFAQELGEKSRKKSMTRATSENSRMDQLDSPVKECPTGTANNSPLQQVQMPSSIQQQTPMQIHTNTPPSEIPVTSSPVEGGTSAIIAGSCGDQGPASDWSFHLPGNGMRMEVPKSKPGPLKEDEKSQQDRSLLRSLLPSQVISDLSEEDLVKEAKMTALRALTLLVQQNPSYLDSDPESLLSQISDLIFQNQENEPPSDTPSLAGLSLQSMISQSLGTLQDMLSTASTMTNFTDAGNQPGAMAPSANQPQEKNLSSQPGHSMTNQLLSTIFISQPEAPASLTNEQSELWTTLQSATARLSLVQGKIQSEQVNFSLTVSQMMKNGQESQQHRHARLLDILQQLCPESLKQVLIGAAYCNGKCKQANCMLAAEVLSYLVECVKEGTVLRCRGCCSVLSHLLDHHVPRCTERRCPVPYCVHLQERTPSSIEEAVGRITAEIGTVGLCTEIVVRTSGDSSFQGLTLADPGIERLEPVLPLGTFGRNVLARAKDRYVTVKQMDKRSLDVLRRLRDCPTPHIVQFFWVQSAENCQEELQVFFAFEQGGSLQSLLTDHGGLKTDRMWPYLHQVLKAVVYLHSMDIVYLAWMADNIVLDSSHQRAKLSNLSYAVELTEETDEEACVQAVTGLPPQILAPEVHNDLSACHQSDIWGLGCLMFQLREGRLPYPHLSHDHPDSIRQKIGEEGELPTIPESWQGQERELLKACWQEEAASRPSAQHLQTLVARYG